MNDLFNSLGNGLHDVLNSIDLSLHDKIKDTTIDTFMHELKDYLAKSDAIYKLSKLPKETLFEINEIEENYVECYVEHQKYDIPKDMVYLNDLNKMNINYDRLQLKSDGLYHFVQN